MEINKNDEKYFQLNDRIEMINDIKKIFDNYLSTANNNLNIFISEVKKNFKEFKKLRNQKINNIYQINSRNAQTTNINSPSRDKANNEYNIVLNSNSKEVYTINNILNNYNDKKNTTSDNFMKNLKQSYFNCIIPNNNVFFNSKNENIFKENEHNIYLSPNPSIYVNKNNHNNIYKKIYLNKSQELIPSKNINNQSIKNESRNQNKCMRTICISKNKNCLSFKSPDISNNNIKYSPINNNYSNYRNKKKVNSISYRNKILCNQDRNNNSEKIKYINNYINNNEYQNKTNTNINNNTNIEELQLAYKVIEFISLLNNVQSTFNNKLNINNQKAQYETLKDNLVNLTNKVIRKNSNNGNKNIINNNFIYNNNNEFKNRSMNSIK